MKNEKIKDKRTSPRFGVMDVVIILLVLVSVVGVYFRYNIIDLISSTKKLQSYTVSYSIENMRSTTTECMDVGDNIYFANDGELLGSFISGSDNTGLFSSRTPTTRTFTKSNGEIIDVLYPNENRIDVQGRFVCEGRYSDDGSFLVNGTRYVSEGQLVEIHTERVTVALRIDDIVLTETE